MRKSPQFFGVLLMASATLCLAGSPPQQWTYDGGFHDTISAANRLVVRPGGVKEGQPIKDDETVFQVIDASEIREIAGHIKFRSPQPVSFCLCYGDPTIDWYRGDMRIACAAIKHGCALRWKGFPGDVEFTQESATWVAGWLAKHGVVHPQKQLEAVRLSEAVEHEAKSILRKFIPAALQDAVKRAATEAESSDATDYLDKERELLDEYIRAAFAGDEEMYAALFRLMGCLPMRWDSRYMPEQNAAYEFLIRAPRDELDHALRSASRGKDLAERRGAARLVFSQQYMTQFEKSATDVSQWMAMLVDTAYDDPFAENRRLILHRLLEYANVQALDILERAVSDPDQTVRRRAIEAIRLWTFMVDFLESGSLNGLQRVCDAIASHDGVDPWLKNMMLGKLEFRRGWEARGTGWGYEVPDEGWRGLAEHMEQARARFTKAWEINPKAPESASHMIWVAMAGAALPGESPQFWFDRAIAAQIDYSLAYWRIRVALSPNWSGSYEQMYSVGRAALTTRRFDSEAPYQVYRSLLDIVQQTGGNYAYFTKPGVYEDLIAMTDGYLAEPTMISRQDWYRALRAAVAWRCHRWEDAREALETVQNESSYSVFAELGADTY